MTHATLHDAGAAIASGMILLSVMADAVKATPATPATPATRRATFTFKNGLRTIATIRANADECLADVKRMLIDQYKASEAKSREWSARAYETLITDYCTVEIV